MNVAEARTYPAPMDQPATERRAPKPVASHCPLWLLLAAGATALGAGTSAQAGESGASFYLLGTGGPEAAVLPPLEGVFFDNTLYHYSGKASGNREFVLGGNLVAGLDADISADFATVLWVPSTHALGGTLAIGTALPIGRPNVHVSAVITGPLGGQQSVAASDVATIIGDPVAVAELGWKLNKTTHATISTQVNVPIGNYREGELSNLAFHRWIVDTSGAVTWHDDESGWDVSGKVGLTFNGTNHFTDYDSGTDLHLEASVEKTLAKNISAGIQVYHLQQISGDSGSGAVLGPNKGRVTGIGPTVGISTVVGKTPLTLRLRYFEEFGVKNRMDGRAFFFSVDFPIWMNMPKTPPHAD
jgi:hypothetical protein